MSKNITFNYITNSSLDNISGGWNGLNYKIHQILSDRFSLNYLGPIEVNVNRIEDLKSKVIRSIGLKSNYPFYSNKRLNDISNKLQKLIKDEYPSIFFGSTPYVNYKPLNDYYIITDISFGGYYTHYNSNNYKNSDIQRIILKEREFLKSAKQVFFTSEWALEDAKFYCNLDGKNFLNIGIGGNVEGYQSIVESDHISLLYISQDFGKKGGFQLFKAFQMLYQMNDNVSFKIIGGTPTEEIINHPAVEYIGYLDKSNREQNNRYIELLSSSDLFVLPTKSDAAPLSIIETGYFGTPTIAPRRFAIPELVIPETSGFLLPSNFNKDDILNKILEYKKLSIEERNSLRKRTYRHFNNNNNWGVIGKRLIDSISNTDF